MCWRRGTYVLIVMVLSLVAACGGGGTARRTRSARVVHVPLGHPALDGILTMPRSGGRYPVVIMLAGSGPADADETTGPNKPFKDLAEGLARRGVATLRYDKRTRQFPGSIDPRTFTATDEYKPDALAAVAALATRADVDPARIVLLGHSQGGTLAPRIAGAEPRIRGVVLLAGAAQPFGDVLRRQAAYLASLPGEIGRQGKAQQRVLYEAAAQVDNPKLKPSDRLTSPVLGGASGAYFLDLRSYNPVAVARELARPILVLQGERDYQVTVADDFNRWMGGLAGRPGVTSHLYPRANHLFIDGTGPPSPADYQRAGHMNPRVIADIATWVKGLPGG